MIITKNSLRKDEKPLDTSFKFFAFMNILVVLLRFLYIFD